MTEELNFVEKTITFDKLFFFKEKEQAKLFSYNFLVNARFVDFMTIKYFKLPLHCDIFNFSTNKFVYLIFEYAEKTTIITCVIIWIFFKIKWIYEKLCKKIVKNIYIEFDLNFKMC